MSNFTENYNKYLATMHIKQNYISRMTGMDENKLSRILNGKQLAQEADMEVLSKAAGKSVQFFLNPHFSLNTDYSYAFSRIAFFTGTTSKKQNELVNNLYELMENIDAVLSAKDSFLQMAMETQSK